MKPRIEAPELGVELIQGGSYSDDRGTIHFVNEFDFRGVDRFYWVVAGELDNPRGWVGHKQQHKWFTVVKGRVLVGIVEPDVWSEPSKELPVRRVLLSGSNPQVVHVPPGRACAFRSCESDSILMIFSTGKVTDSQKDDYRFPIDQWPLCEA